MNVVLAGCWLFPKKHYISCIYIHSQHWKYVVVKGCTIMHKQIGCKMFDIMRLCTGVFTKLGWANSWLNVDDKWHKDWITWLWFAKILAGSIYQKYGHITYCTHALQVTNRICYGYETCINRLPSSSHKSLEAHACKPSVTNLSIVCHT